MGDHIWDNVGLDAQGAVKLVVPHSVDLGSFPAASTQKGGWRLDAMSGDMLWSNGVVWRKSGSVASVAAADLSPLFTTVVNNPTTDPSIVFTLPNINQYEVFGRSAVGSGAPGWVTLPATAFTGYTQGTGITIAGNVITNTLPSKWTVVGSYIKPNAVGTIRTNDTASYGYATIAAGTGSSSGYLEIYKSTGARVGYIGYNENYMLYEAQIGYHRFATGYVSLDNIPNYAAANQILVNNGGVISYATKAQLGITYTAGSGIDITSNIIKNILWNRSGTMLSTYNSGDFVDINSLGISPFAALSVGLIGYTDANYQANIVLSQNDSYAIDKGASIAFYPQCGGFYGNGKIGFYKENTTSGNQDTYFSVSTRTGASNYTTDSVKLKVFADGRTKLTNIPTASTNDLLISDGGIISTRLISTLPFTNNAGTVTNFSAHDLNTLYADPLFTVNVTNSSTIPDLTFTLPTLSQKLVFAAPWGISGKPFWRQLLPSDLQSDGASSGQVIAWNGSAWVPTTGGAGTVTGVNSGNGMNFTNFNTSGTITMGTPSSITLSSSNSTSTTSHTHAFAPGGSATTQFISGAGTLVTNLWRLQSGYLTPNSTSAYRTNDDASNGYARFSRGSATNTAYLEFFDTSGARLGYIGYFNTDMTYYADSGYHNFRNKPIQVVDLAGSGTRMVVASSTGVLSTQAIPSGASPVWKIQGGTTDATSNTDAIYHANKVLIGTTGSSSYMLSVNGNGYFNTGIDINNYNASSCAIRAADNTATFRNMAYLDGSNIFNFATTYVKVNGVGVSDAGAVTLSAYGSGRTLDSISINPDNLVYFSTAGKMLKARGELFKDDGGSASITTSETNHIADSTPRRITFDSLDTVQDSYVTFDTTSGDVKLKFGSADMKYMFWIYIEYTTGGTPTIKMDARKSSSATIFRTVTKTSPNARDFIILQGFASGATSDYLSIVLTVSGAALTSVVKAEAFLIPIGLSPP